MAAALVHKDSGFTVIPPGSSTWRCLARGRSGLACDPREPVAGRPAGSSRTGPAGADPSARIAKRAGGAPARPSVAHGSSTVRSRNNGCHGINKNKWEVRVQRSALHRTRFCAAQPCSPPCGLRQISTGAPRTCFSYSIQGGRSKIIF